VERFGDSKLGVGVCWHLRPTSRHGQTAPGDFGSRYVKTSSQDYFASGVAKGVAVSSEKSAKTSSKTRLQLRTVSVNTCVHLLRTRCCLWRLPARESSSSKTTVRVTETMVALGGLEPPTATVTSPERCAWTSPVLNSRERSSRCYVIYARPHWEWPVHDLARATLRARWVISFLEGLMAEIKRGRWTAQIEGDFVVFLIGALRLLPSHPLTRRSRWPPRHEPHARLPVATSGQRIIGL
jgi:hypothetical protein